MNNKTLLALGLAITLSSGAQATSTDTQGWNLGVGAAMSFQQYESSVDDTLYNAHVSAGYRFNSYLGLEARIGKGFTDIELPEYERIVEQGLFYSGYLKAMYPLSSGFTPYLLVGAQNSELVIDPNSTTDTSLSYGLGLSYRLQAKTVAVDVGIEALNAFQHSDLDYDVWDFGLKVGYQF
jgi:opacity protein-like surface antigen